MTDEDRVVSEKRHRGLPNSDAKERGVNSTPRRNHFLLGRCVRALAATLFTAAGVFGFANNFEALLATAFEVTSLFRFDIGLTLFRVRGAYSGTG